ncbi:MAG TPA: DNA polymerase IV [Rhodanobacteraceae bacterium]|nr:DNA polymerase IV [Rhodanobacteraceae bacterium]
MPAPQRKIVHVDMDAFYASVEQRDDPALRGKPVIVAWTGARSVVLTASYEARPFGVHSAMSALRAARLCPQGIFVRPDFARYKAASRRVREIFARHTDLIEPLSLDEAYLDVTVNKQGLASATAVAQSIRTEIRNETGLTASAGVAGNKFLAKIASDYGKPDGLFVVRPRAVLGFLAPLGVERLPGVGKVMQRKLETLGIHKVADLRTVASDELERRFGRYGRRLHDLAFGIDDRPVLIDRPTLQISSEDTFEADLLLDELGPHIERLAEHTWAVHRREAEGPHGRVARTVVLKLKTSDFHVHTRSITPADPPASARQLAAIASALRARVDLPARTRYRLVGVGLAGFVERDAHAAAQRELFALA